MPLIPLSNRQGSVVGHALVDEADLAAVSKHTWYLKRFSNGPYVATNVRAGLGRQRTVLMHRLLMGPRCRSVVDHVNGNGLDNRRSNLRICTSAQNNMNRRSAPGACAKGVTRHRARYRASITVARRRIYLGLFTTEAEAAAAYVAAARHHFGEFARIP